MSPPVLGRILGALIASSCLAACGGHGSVSVPTQIGTQAADGVISRSTTSDLALDTTAPLTSTTVEMPRHADLFVDSVGVNTHLHFTDTPYVTAYSKVYSALRTLRVRHIRDALVIDSYSTYQSRLEQLATNGVHIDITTLMNQPTSMISSFVKLVPNGVDAVEAPNEYDLTGDPKWASKLRSYQKTLYTAVNGSTKLEAIPVYGPSITSYRDSIVLGNLSSDLDYGNMHDYFATLNPGTAGGTVFPVGKYGSLPFWIGTAALISGSKPVVTTETGYVDRPVVSDWVTASVKARYTLRLLLEQWNARVARTYLYELVDIGNQALGLLDSNVNPKPVFTGLANLLAQLSDPGSTFNLTPLTYTKTANATVHHALLEKRDHSYHFLCWDEVPQIDPSTPRQTLTLGFKQRFHSVTQYTWQDDGSVRTTPITQNSAGSVSVTVTDRLTDLKLVP